ncbi:MAG: serine/threonine-protein kinase, partial [Phycisphaerales bacterium]|nr:serine/threonine-protein kinase [Phycisphaerales bacterium]
MNHERVQQILQDALQLNPERRDSFIHESCQGDASLEQEVRSLLGHEPIKGPQALTIQDSSVVQPGSLYTKGDRLDGATAFVILRLISSGAFGEVYEAEEVGDVTRRVVVKILKEERSNSPAIIHRFEMERQFIARVTHPNVVKLVGYGTSADGRPYFAMEHVGGVPLLKYCAKERLPFEKRLGLFIEICKGLQAIHNAGILHLDLKPANILVSEDDHGAYGSGRCTIIDFGIAVQNSRPATDSWRTSAQRKLWGTHGYMSPEMLDGDYNAIDQRSDLWALGVVLTELLTGHNPTADIRDADSLRSSVRERQADLTSTFHKLDSTTTEKLAEEFRTNVQRLRRDLSSELSAVTRKAMSEQRDGRYRSADAMR